MIDHATETLIRLTDVPKALPRRRGGARLNLSTLWRWQARGVRGNRLETLSIGGARYTSKEALARFFDACSARPGTPPPPPSPAQRARQIRAAERELAEAGIR